MRKRQKFQYLKWLFEKDSLKKYLYFEIDSNQKIYSIKQIQNLNTKEKAKLLKFNFRSKTF